MEIDAEDRPVEGPLTGSRYVITGTLEGYTREEAKAALEALGAKVSDGVSSKTTGVIVGESPGSKVAKAQKAGVPLLTEADSEASCSARLGSAGEDGREAVLRLARPEARDRAPVLQHREDVAVAHEAGERGRGVGRPGLRDHASARRARLQPVLERAGDAGDREAAEERVPAARVGEPRLEQRDDGGRREAVEAREARAVCEPHAGERHSAAVSSSRTMRVPAAVLPLPAKRAPSCFTSISAV